MSETSTFYTKQIQSPFTNNEDTTPIILQNKNGPCFIISLINTILLSSSLAATTSSSDSIVTHFKSTLSDKPTVSLSDVLNFLVDSIIEANNNFVSEDLSIDELIKLLPTLDSGLNINPYLNNTVVSNFYENTQLINQLLDYFNIKIYHGFIMSNELISQLDGLESFDKCQDFIIDCMDNEPADELKLNKFKNLKVFLDDNKTELTKVGINELLKSLENNEVNIFFRNNHFSTIYKFNDCLYLLINDLGYKNQLEIIWQVLSISDDLDYLNSKFQIPVINEEVEKEKSDNENNVRDENNNTVENNYDLELAKQLQLEEDEQISKNLQKKYDDNSKLETNTNSRPASSSKTTSKTKPNNKGRSKSKSKNKPKTQQQSQPKGTSNKQKNSKSTKNLNNSKDSRDCVIM